MSFVIKFLVINIFLITNSYSNAIKPLLDLVIKYPVIKKDINETIPIFIPLLQLLSPFPTCDSKNKINRQLLLDCLIGRKPFFSQKCRRLGDIRQNCKDHNTPFKKVIKKNILKKNNSDEIKKLLKSISTD